MAEQIQNRLIEEEMKDSYIDYSMSVIVGRALPDVHDGLKPVHRRILFAMNDLGLSNNKPTKKSARVVGEVLGKYHPHGDIAVYDALVRMAQDFSLRYPLVVGQGNFGCFTKDTKVQLTDGRVLSFEQLIEENKENKRNFTYTIDNEKNIKVAEIKNPRLTIKKAQILRIVLDNRAEIKCTHNHLFMLRGGSFKEAKNLTNEDSLMPLNKMEMIATYNHKVISVEFLNEKQDVYDLTIENTHNFALSAGIFVHNSVDGDSSAHMRYTEVKLSKMGEELLEDIDKETVKLVFNFDNSTKEPVILPSKFPNLLLNGSSGIAVGMATNMPPHNLSEVVDATIKLIENPNITIEEIMQFIKGPDFPTGALILGRVGILNAYKTGRGQLKLRANVEIKEKRLIVTEIPYQVNKSLLIEGMADLVRDKRVEGISDIRDESDRKGMRIVIELKSNANPEVVLNQLYKHSQLQTTFGVINLALVAGQPKILDLKSLISSYVKHRKRIVTRRTQFELTKAEDRAHILEGLKIALNNIDSVVKVIKSSDSVENARSSLMKTFELTEKQAVAILEMRLQRLTSLETSKVRKEHEELVKLSIELKSILADESKIYNIIKQELSELKQKYHDERRTKIIDALDEEIEDEDLIKEEQVVITMTHQGYVKRLPIDTYKQQKRGGKGIIATETKEEDFVEHLFTSSTHNYILLFTDKGNVFWLKGYKIPDASRYSKGSNIVNMLNLEKDEKITSMIPIKEFKENEYLLMATKKGVLKKTASIEYSNPRKNGIIAINLRDNDKLVNVKLTDGNQKYIIASKNGLAVRFNEADARSIGRNATGVRGIRLSGNDEVIGLELATNDKDTLLTATENGYGKRSLIEDYRIIRRGGKGVINIKTSGRNGKVVAIKTVKDDHELMFITKKGILIRTGVSEISVVGRNTQGVRLMKLDSNDKLVNVARIINNGN